MTLNGAWRVRQAGKRTSIPATVPGCIHTDLLAAGAIDDPFIRDNELALQWIGEVDWVYFRSFTVSPEMLTHDRVLLRCDGLDTLATITLNGVVLPATDNAFRIWEFEIGTILKKGRNTIEIRLNSTIPVINDKQATRHLPGFCGPKEIQGRAWIRKSPCNYGWDWGPALITCGIWRPITIVAFNTARFGDIMIRQDHSTPERTGLNVVANLDLIRGDGLTCDVKIAIDNEQVAAAKMPVIGASADVALTIANPKLWWPNGMGAQPLYAMTVELRDKSGQLIDSTCRRIGLRTLRLDRHPDQWGESFQFAINGMPFFAKGGNWIPADTFVTRLTRERYADLLQSVASANMNMLRLWGGGIYENDMFYDLCDELGICVWHDFMFACSTYPAFDEHFMRTVRTEAEENVKRVRHHACLALWCGNNELEQGAVGEQWSNGQMSWEDYKKLFDKLLPDVVHALAPDTDYWPCSPHSPLGDRKDFNNPNCGDAHLWDVWHGRKPFEWYRTCTHRFNSEFGFQSFPEPKTVTGFTNPQDRNITTRVMEHHQRNGIGNMVIMQYMLEWYRMPGSFWMTLWLSQILQGMAMKYAVEHWRRAMPRGMGTLYWQINDCWPVASWSSIDYHGRWKALHYMARRFYAPLLISGVEDLEAGTVQLHVTSDLTTTRTGVATWLLTDVAGLQLDGGRMNVSITPCANIPVTTLNLKPHIEKHGPYNLLLWVSLDVDGNTVSTNFVSFARPKHLELSEPRFRMKIDTLDHGEYAVRITANKPALWVWLELETIDARFSDNFFHMVPGQPAHIAMKPAKPIPLSKLMKLLRIRSLVDTYR